MTKLLCISLHQPFASLIMVWGPRRKGHETRHWPYPASLEKTRIGIHAAQRVLPRSHTSPELERICVEQWSRDWRDMMPRGALLGSVLLSGCYPTELREPDNPADRVAGDWSDGRYAWALRDVQVFTPVIPMPGRQRWWRVDITDSV